jgi:lactocepin
LILLTKTLGLESDVTENFSDVLPGQYYYEAIGIGKKLGIATGTGNNVFKPKDSISRQDMFVMTEKALKIKGRIEPTGNLASLEAFSDNAAVSNYAKGSITNLLSEGLVSGFAGKINPRANTTRAEAAVFLYRIY